MRPMKHTEFRGAEIAYKIRGNGVAVVLLHGFLEDSTMWDELTKELAETNTVIAVDLPGFGDSGMIDSNHTMKIMCDAVAAVLSHEGINKCFMVGHSMGGYVMLEFANRHQEMLNGIVLFHSQAAADDDNTKENRNRTIKIVESNHANFISSFIPSLFTDENAIKYKAEIDRIINQSLLTKNEGIIASLAGMRDRSDRIELLGKLEIPVLFIAGKQDSRIPLNKIMEQITLPKLSQSLILNNVGHMGFVEAKSLTFKALKCFINN